MPSQTGSTTDTGALGTFTGRQLIDGKLVGGDAGTYPSLNPATGEILGHAPVATPAQAAQAVAAARRAFDEGDWATNTDLRVRCLHQLHQALRDNVEALRALTIAEVGATVQLTKGPQLEQAIEIVSYYADLLWSHPLTDDLGEIEYNGRHHHRWVEKEAAGVVAAIVAYNYPNQLALAKLAPALAAGCTVVLKAAPDTPLVTLAIGEIVANHTDIPAGVVNVISSPAVEVGEVLTTSPEVDLVTFTGSTAVGRRIMAAASETVKRVFLELGGKSALIVLDDLDEKGLQAAAMFAAFSIVVHSGQGCALTSRMLVNNPLSGLYKTKDDRWLSFVMMQPTKFWADVCRHIDRPELAADVRFATSADIAANTEAGVQILRDVIATRTLAEWSERFATLAGPGAPVQDSLQVSADAQVRANEYLVSTGELDLAANPVQFDVTAPELRPAPEFAAQTEEVLLELGLDWDEILALKTAGAVS
jgi:hypothetical protein